MGIVIVLAMLAIGGIMLVGVMGGGLIAATGSKNKAIAANPDTITDALFNGNPQVVYTRTLGIGVTDEALLAAATKHGYAMTTTSSDQYSTRMVFTRQSSLTT